MNWVCATCKIEFPEEIMDISHDIPKWMQGTDRDGRHALCKKCHEEYENKIIERCCSFVGEKFNKDYRIEWMMKLSKQPTELKKKFIEIAKQIKMEQYGNTHQVTTAGHQICSD